VEAFGTPDEWVLRRRITVFRQAAGGWRGATSCTPCACIRAGSCWTTWSRPGFQTRVLAGYGHAVRFRRGHAGILAVKPSNGPS
jgi:hypothetical protein